MKVACWHCGEAESIGNWKVGLQGHLLKRVKAGQTAEGLSSRTTKMTVLAGMPVSRRAKTCETEQQS